MGGGNEVSWKYFNFWSEGQYFLMIFMVIDAEGENLVVKGSLLMFFLVLGYSSKDLSRNLTLLVCV